LHHELLSKLQHHLPTELTHRYQSLLASISNQTD